MLRFDDVGLAFRGGDGVHDLSFRVDAGEIVALVGLNGAGKTTLMRLALGMLRPDSGSVRVLGHPLDDLPVARWADVGALIEVPLAYPELTARENLCIACRLRGVDPAVVPGALDAWQLTPVADRRFRRLSLGTRQRVGLAAAMQHDPRLIVLDEPGNGLDPASVILLREQLLRRAGDGAGVLVSSHHLDEVTRIADRVILMNRGGLIGELDTAGSDLERVFFDRIRVDDEIRVGARR
ncbi:ABC transporter ATP-binding protein [Microbacterium sp. KUDC0406]|uniref:ABC transporter ATP-binding protein n=1 Tax=Microbacterium sp. KUDC0406 TaxID=2909588 RepID=UPI001F327917|nr:ABC transporter ATP-binding protein [Microbacterium sp. KUDC0406]UJP09153.1 ABC transporter ATP-binding protein [Microbacterium sp. KUDC0406]